MERNIARELIYAVKDYFLEVKFIQGIPQCIDEVLQVVEYLQGKKFNNLVDFGSADGGSLWLYSLLLCNKDAKITGIEQYSSEFLKSVCICLQNKGYKNARAFVSTRALDKVNSFHNDEIDLLHIDDDHQYDLTQANYKGYYPKVKNGGIMLFHDVISSKDVNRVFMEAAEENGNYKIFTGSLLLSATGWGRPFTTGIGLIEKDDKT